MRHDAIPFREADHEIRISPQKKRGPLLAGRASHIE
jgi:hypothetical protein